MFYRSRFLSVVYSLNFLFYRGDLKIFPWFFILYVVCIYIVCMYGTNEIRYAIYKYLFTSILIFARKTFYCKFCIKEKYNMVNVWINLYDNRTLKFHGEVHGKLPVVTTRIRNVRRDPSHLFSHLYQRDTKTKQLRLKNHNFLVPRVNWFQSDANVYRKPRMKRESSMRWVRNDRARPFD